MASEDKFSPYDTKADIHDLGVGTSLSTLSDRSRDTSYLKGNKSAVGRAQPRGIHNDRAWKGACEVEGCGQVRPSRFGPGHADEVINKATHLVTSMNDGDVSMKKVCGKHADQHLFEAQSAGHNVLTGIEQKGTVQTDKPITIVARLTRRNNEAYRAHHGLEPETIGNVNGTGAQRKIKKTTPLQRDVKTETGAWVPESQTTSEDTEAPKRGRPVGAGDSAPRKRRIPISEIRGDADKPKRGRGRPAGSKNNPDAPKRKKKAAVAPIKRMVNGREMTVTIIPENTRATERGMKLSRGGRNYKGSGKAV